MPRRGNGSPSKVSGSSATYSFWRDHCLRRWRGPEHAAPLRTWSATQPRQAKANVTRLLRFSPFQLPLVVRTRMDLQDASGRCAFQEEVAGSTLPTL